MVAIPSFAAAHLDRGIEKIISTSCAFAALKRTYYVYTSVVTWGDEDFGGDSSHVAHLLADGILDIFPKEDGSGLIAVKTDGSKGYVVILLLLFHHNELS